MTTLAIEINDAGIVVARSEKIVAAEPGYAAASDGHLVFGEEALRVSRLRPHEVSNRYWADLSLEALPRPLLNAKTSADLVHAHLTQLWKRYAGDAEELFLVVPGGLDRTRLSLLLGIAEAGGLPVRGLVDSAAAASQCGYPGWDSVLAESGLHEIGLTRLSGTDCVVAESYEIVSADGIASLHEQWARCIAASFVAQTRFDPLSDGRTEQRFYNALPAWIETLSSSQTSLLEFDAGGGPHQIRFSQGELASETEGVYGRITRSISDARHPRRGLVVRAGPMLQSLPGLAERLSGIPGVRVAPLDPGAAALGALASANEIRGTPGKLALVTTLPWRERNGTVSPLRSGELEGSTLTATHLLIRSVAHPIPTGGLWIRLGETEQSFAITDRQRNDADFVLQRSERGLTLELPDNARVLLNGEVAPSESALVPGDRLGILGSTRQAMLIAVVNDGT